MSLNLNLTSFGAWELTYFQKTVGNLQNRQIRAPLIEPIEIPYLTDQRIFVVAASFLAAKPTWQRAGYLYQQIQGINIDDTVIFPGLERIPNTEIDYARFLIKLNNIQLVIFEKLTDSYRLRFEPLPWIPEVTLALWEYRGTESNTTNELINAVRSKLETIEFKIDNL